MSFLPAHLRIPALTALTLTTFHGAVSDASGSTAEMDKLVKPFFAEHCTSCHGDKKQKGDLRVDDLVVNFKSPKIMMHWEEIMNRINSGDMPPDDEPRPKPEEISKVADWIAGQLHEAEAAKQSSGSDRVSFHKLTREEYAVFQRIQTGKALSASAPCSHCLPRMWRSISRLRMPFLMRPCPSVPSRSAR
jgi:mono/diheme cytochrome c family protein